MLKLFIVAIILSLGLYAQSVKDLTNKINTNKNKIGKVSNKKKDINRTLTFLAKKIIDDEKTNMQILKVLENTNNKIILNKMRLDNALTTVKKLKKSSKDYKRQRNILEKNVIDFVIERYAMTMGIMQANKASLEDVIGKEVYTLIFDNVKQEILELNVNYLKLNSHIRKNEKKILKYTVYIKKQETIKEKYKNLELVHEKSLELLKLQHGRYQKNLKEVINRQNKLTDLLGKLNILKKKEIRKEEKRIKKVKALAKKRLAAKKRKEKLLAKKQRIKNSKNKVIKFKKRNKFDDNINIEVRKIGSSAKGIKISKYRGLQTISPLKSYTVVKKFGKYYDKVYKMELFNESVSLKTKKPNAKVLSVFKGQIVYAKQNSGLLENVVIVKHRNNLHTIYSHLDKISPTLKVGKWIPKGYVVGRINDILQFQATKDSKYIDPLRLIKKERRR